MWASHWGKHFSTGQNLLKKYQEKINIDKNCCLKKVDSDTINCEKLFDRSADHK